MPCDPILARVELASNHAVLAERATDFSPIWPIAPSGLKFLPIAPALLITLGFDCGIAFVPLFAPSLSAATVVLSVMFPDMLGVDWFAVPRPSCSWRGPVDSH